MTQETDEQQYLALAEILKIPLKISMKEEESPNYKSVKKRKKILSKKEVNK